MRRAILAVAIAAASLLAWSFITSAQVIDMNDPCQQACYEQEEVCVDQCGTHVNPVECEANCHDERAACLRRCRTP